MSKLERYVRSKIKANMIQFFRVLSCNTQRQNRAVYQMKAIEKLYLV